MAPSGLDLLSNYPPTLPGPPGPEVNAEPKDLLVSNVSSEGSLVLTLLLKTVNGLFCLATSLLLFSLGSIMDTYLLSFFTSSLITFSLVVISATDVSFSVFFG